MKLNSFTLAALIIVLLFGGIGFSTAMSWWQTENSKIAATYSKGEFVGQANPADIRGSYTFGDVNKNFDVPLTDLASAFRLSADVDPAGFQVKELETISADLPVEIGTASVRMFVAFYKGFPYDLSSSEETYLFPEAAVILKAQHKLLPEQAAYLESHLVPEKAAPVVETPALDLAATLVPTEHAAPDRTVTGKTTFQDLLDWGVDQAAIEAVLSDTMPAPQTLIKDFVTQKGLEFSSIKTALQSEVEKHK
jgi:hypothetical protein